MIRLGLRVAWVWLKGLPWPVWAAVGMAALLLLTWRWHVGEIRHADKAGFSRGVEVTQAAFRKELERVRAEAIERRDAHDRLAAELANARKDAHDEQARRIAADARSLLVRGPGRAAVCRPGNHPSVSAGAGQQGAPAKPDAAGPGVPSADLAAVPWSWLVGRAESHDLLLNRVNTWERWYAEQAAAWEKMMAKR